jgi:predicted NUDIX family phosphoesterase
MRPHESSETKPAGADGPSSSQEPVDDAGDGPPVEQVLVVPRKDLVEAGQLPQGFLAGGCADFLSLVALKGTFLPRPRVEEDPTLKQVIPYAVVKFREKVFLFRRTSRGGEARLHRKVSIGVCGHVNPEGVSAEAVVETGLRRELAEELTFDRPYRHRPIGLVNDDGTPVGRVHVGIVYLVEAADEGVRVRETEVLEGGFSPIASLGALLEEMETWSRIVAENVFLGKESLPFGLTPPES